MTTTRLTIALDRLSDIRTGDRVVALDDRPADLTVTHPLHFVGTGDTQGISVSRPGRNWPFNIYAGSQYEATLTIERDEADSLPLVTAVAVDRRNATHLSVGDRIIVENSAHGLRATRRKTRVHVVTVIGKVKSGYRSYAVETTGGTFVTMAAVVFGIADDL